VSCFEDMLNQYSTQPLTWESSSSPECVPPIPSDSACHHSCPDCSGT
jgi:hypothetical protein